MAKNNGKVKKSESVIKAFEFSRSICLLNFCNSSKMPFECYTLCPCLIFQEARSTVSVVVHLANIHLVLFVLLWWVLTAGCCRDRPSQASSRPESSPLTVRRCLPASLHRPVHPLPPWVGHTDPSPLLIQRWAGWGRRRHLGYLFLSCAGVSTPGATLSLLSLQWIPCPGSRRPASVGASEGRSSSSYLTLRPPCRLTLPGGAHPKEGAQRTELRAGVLGTWGRLPSEHGQVCLALREWLAQPTRPGMHPGRPGTLPSGLRVEASPCGSEGKSRAPPGLGPLQSPRAPLCTRPAGSQAPPHGTM